MLFLRSEPKILNKSNSKSIKSIWNSFIFKIPILKLIKPSIFNTLILPIKKSFKSKILKTLSKLLNRNFQSVKYQKDVESLLFNLWAKVSPQELLSKKELLLYLDKAILMVNLSSFMINKEISLKISEFGLMVEIKFLKMENI